MGSPAIPGRQALDGPPPSPANPPDATPAGAGAGPTPPGAGAPGTQGPGGGSAAKAVVMMGSNIDQALMALAKAAPGSVTEFSQARRLIQKGVAKILSTMSGGQTGSPTPTTAGAPFMGGGIGGAM